MKNGYRVIYDASANAFGNPSGDIKDDFRALSNKAERFYRLIFSEWSNMLPPKNLFSFMFVSHRLLQLLVPFMLAIILATSFALQHNKSIQILLIVQLVIYSFAFISWFLRKTPILRGYTSIVMYFVVMNIALLNGFMKYLFSAIKSLFSRKKRLVKT